MNKMLFFIAKVLQRIPGIDTICEIYNVYRHKRLEKELNPILKKVAKECRYLSTDSINTKKIIWFFWWQGVDTMPLLVKKCYQSIIKNRGNRELYVITKDNFQKYTDFSDEELKKLINGSITLTHFSDLLRFNLLKNYGGLWLDATMYITASLDYIEEDEIYTNSGYAKNRLFNVAGGRWTGFMIGGPQNNELFQFMDNFFKEYWSNYDKLVDYFLIDYGLNYAYKHNIGEFQKASIKFKGINPNMFELQPLINNKFEKKDWDYLKKETHAFKLSNKKRILDISDSYFYNL